MQLNNQQQNKILKYITTYHRYLTSEDSKEDQSARKDREDLFRRVLSQANISSMSELEFGQVMSSLWASQMWGNKSYWIDNLLDENSLDTLKIELSKLLWEEGKIDKRYDQFRKAIKGFGTATIAEILSFMNPNKYGIWNNKARKALTYLGYKDQVKFIKKSQLSGKEYCEFNVILKGISDVLATQLDNEINLLDINYFLFEVAKYPQHTEDATEVEIQELTKPLTPDDFEHDEVIDRLVAIGGWLGFESEKEKNIAVGARVDAVWQARIANLGVVTYVFEVQKKGSVDSLVLNLQKAQNNPSVQRLVVIATECDIKKIKGEVNTLPEGFRKAVSYLEVSELLRASDLLSEFSEIIEKLKLVQGEFDIYQ